MFSRLIILTLFVASACRSHDESHSAPAATGSAAPAADPCGYATKEEVGAAIGLPIVLAEQVSPDQCAYYPEPKPSNALYVRVSDGGPYDAMKQTMRNTAAVAGLGDDAMWAKPQLMVHAGSKMISIQVMDVRWKAGDSQSVAVEVANKVLTHIAR